MKRRKLEHPGRWLWLLLLIPIGFGLQRLHFDVEVFDLLPTNLEAVEGLKLYQQHFADARELLVTVQGADPDHAEAAAREIAQSLRAHSNLVSSVTWEPPWLEHPEQSGELIAYLWLNQSPAEFRELTNRLAPNQLSNVLANTREELASSMSPDQIGRLSYDPFGLTQLPQSAATAAPDFTQGQSMFASSNGDFRVIFVEASHELRTYRDCDAWLKQVKPIVSEAAIRATNGSKPVELGFTGRPAFVSEVAKGMQRDVQISVLGTAAIIAVLFYIAHRRIKPMLWLLTLLALILGSTLALGGLIFGTINVVSMGFAAILLGLAVDYAVVHYQEALAHPALTVPEIRSEIAPSIFWAAVTTISAFLVLNFGGLPGLGQLGTMVGLGVGLSALIMIFEFLPPLFPGRSGRGPKHEPHGTFHITEEPSPTVAAPPPASRRAWTFGITAVVLVATIADLLFSGLPVIDPTANALRPRHSPAYDTMDKIQKTLANQGEALSLVVSGDSIESVGRSLRSIEAALNQAVSNNWITSYKLPTPLWPVPENQQANKPAAGALARQRTLFHQAALSNGFSESSFALSDRILDTLQAASAATAVFWPTNPMSRWIFQKFASLTPSNYFVVGLVTPRETNHHVNHEGVTELRKTLPAEGVWLSGWDLLGSAIFSRVKANMWKVISPMIFLVMLSLWLAFRRPREILLSLFALALSAMFLLALMRVVGWSWNLLNLMAVPLILGTGVDYSIFMQLALRRYHGDLRMAWISVGRALLLCGGTAIAGFGSLAISSNAGMASLGQVCSVGIGCNMLIAIFLLPVWWHATGRAGAPPPARTH